MTLTDYGFVPTKYNKLTQEANSIYPIVRGNGKSRLTLYNFINHLNITQEEKNELFKLIDEM